MKKRFFRAWTLFLITALCLSVSSCFSGAQNDRTASGEREGIIFSYIAGQDLLLLGGNGTLKSTNRILSLPFAGQIRYLFVGKGVYIQEKNVFGALPELSLVWFEGTPSYDTAAVCGGDVRIVLNADDFETRAGEPYGDAVGHCPVPSSGVCVLCGRAFSYCYDNRRCSLLRDGKTVYDETLILEGQKRRFNAEGYLEADGFQTLGGETRYFENGSYVAGTRDMDGVRYSFSSEGLLTDEKALDSAVPAYQIVLPLLTLPLGAAVCFGVYRFHQYKEKKEEKNEPSDGE